MNQRMPIDVAKDQIVGNAIFFGFIELYTPKLKLQGIDTNFQEFERGDMSFGI